MGLLSQILGGLAGGGRPSPMSPQLPMGRGGGVNPRVLMALLPIVLNLLANRRRGGGMGGFGGGMGGMGGGGLGGLGGRGGGLGGGLGGLAGLLGQMAQRGYGQQAESWIGTGPNQPLAPDDVSQLFDSQQLSEIASEAGVSEDEARLGLSELLPEVVDHFTPQGQLPGEDELLNSVDDYARQLGG